MLENIQDLTNNDETPFIVKKEPKPLSILKMIALSICFLGVQFGWAVQIAFTSPLFLELGMPKFAISFVWLAGPISGLLVQPTIGILSDRCTSKWGRRKPFILIGTICIVIGMILISNAQLFSEIFGNNSKKTVAIVLAIIGFWILDLSNNVVQGPCRALLVDVAPPSQQVLGASFFSLMLGLGNFTGYFIGSLKLTKVMPFFGTNLRALFVIAMTVLIICIGITLIFIKEEKFISDKKKKEKKKNPFSNIIYGIIHMPIPIRRICVVQFFSWFAWFTFILYITTWVGENIYHGNPDAEENSPERNLFDEGVRVGAFGLTINSVVTIIFSLILPKLTKYLGIKLIYFISQLILTLCLLLPFWIDNKIGAIILISLFGIPWATVMILPFSIVGISVKENESGLYMGILNIFVVLPQLLVSITIGFVIEFFNGNIIAAFVVGSISAFLSSVFVWFLIIKKTPIIKKIDESESIQNVNDHEDDDNKENNFIIGFH